MRSKPRYLHNKVHVYEHLSYDKSWEWHVIFLKSMDGVHRLFYMLYMACMYRKMFRLLLSLLSKCLSIINHCCFDKESFTVGVILKPWTQQTTGMKTLVRFPTGHVRQTPVQSTANTCSIGGEGVLLIRCPERPVYLQETVLVLVGREFPLH